MTKILEKVSNNQITIDDAYSKIYKREIKKSKKNRANFIKIKLRIKENPFISFFVNLFMIIPLPVVIAKPFLKKQLTKNDMPNVLYQDAINNAKGFSIKVDSKEAKIRIRLF